MSELKSGGLAMVFGLHEDTEFNGLMVTTETRLSENESYVSPETGEYSVYFGPGLAWLCTGHINPFGFGFFDPKNLMPIDNTDPDVVELATCDTDKVGV